ncbi:MAG: hypothetical protein ACQERD_09860 [Campylobacterota bacterium]
MRKTFFILCIVSFVSGFVGWVLHVLISQVEMIPTTSNKKIDKILEGYDKGGTSYQIATIVKKYFMKNDITNSTVYFYKNPEKPFENQSFIEKNFVSNIAAKALYPYSLEFFANGYNNFLQIQELPLDKQQFVKKQFFIKSKHTGANKIIDLYLPRRKNMTYTPYGLYYFEDSVYLLPFTYKGAK